MSNIDGSDRATLKGGEDVTTQKARQSDLGSIITPNEILTSNNILCHISFDKQFEKNEEAENRRNSMPGMYEYRTDYLGKSNAKNVFQSTFSGRTGNLKYQQKNNFRIHRLSPIHNEYNQFRDKFADSKQNKNFPQFTNVIKNR